MPPASLPWLLRHELLLWWRDFRSRPGAIVGVIVMTLLFLFLFLLLWVALSVVRGAAWAAKPTELNALGDVFFWLAVMFWLLGFCYAFVQAINQSVVALFDRGDLDLLVASPVSGKVVFASRLLGVAIAILFSYIPILGLVSLLAIALGFPRLLGIFPAVIGLSLTVASLAMLLTLWLVKWLGARRARTFAQILAALLTAAFFLLSQLPNLLRGPNASIDAATLAYWQTWFEQGSPLGVDSWIWFPVRAMFFDPKAVCLTLLVSGGLAWLAVETLHRSFLVSTQQSLTVKRQSPIRETYFSGRFYQTALLKEWRIMWRNPYLISATFLQILFLLPALVIIGRGDVGGRAFGSLNLFVTIISIVIGESLTQTLVRVCVSAEEAPDLLKSSPMRGPELRRFKLLAALIPVWLLLSPVFVIVLTRGKAWFPAFVVFLAATTCAAVLRLWNSQPIALADLFKRRQQHNVWGDLLLGLLEVISLFTWVFLGIAVNQRAIVSVICLAAVIAGVVTIAHWRSRQLGTSLGF